MIEVRWYAPPGLPSDFTKVRIERSAGEQGPYVRIGETDAYEGGLPIAQWVDSTGERSWFYLIKYFSPTRGAETDPVLGFFPLTPKELRLTGWVESWLPDILKPDLNEPTYSLAFRFAVSAFNVQPPETYFTLDTFPADYEQYLVMGAQVNIALNKYLRISIQDYSYNDMGFSMTIDRGSKVAKAAEDIGKMYQATIERAKWNFTPMGIGLGSIPMGISMGGTANRNMMNVMDIMNSVTR